MSTRVMYEYTATSALEGDAANYIVIPEDIYLTNEANDHLVSVYAYFYIKRGLDNTISFSVNQIVKWLGRQPNRNKNGINNKVIECIEYLQSQNYLSISKNLNNASINEAIFNSEKVKRDCEGHFFILIYLDELKKILHYQKPKSDNSHLGNEIILLVFLYLKYHTFKRGNKLKLEEMYTGGWEDIERRRAEMPEAYDA